MGIVLIYINLRFFYRIILLDAIAHKYSEKERYLE